MNRWTAAFLWRGWRVVIPERLQSGGMGKLYTSTSRRDSLLAAYYFALLDDSQFCNALERLLDQLEENLFPITKLLVKREYGLTTPQKDLIIFGYRLAKTDDPKLSAGINPAALKSKLEPDIVFAACRSAELTLASFIEAWKLPFDSKSDLLDFYYRTRLKQTQNAGFRRKALKGIDSDWCGGWIDIPSFYYDPTCDTNEWLEKEIQKIIQEIKRRAKEIRSEQKKKGLKPMPSRWRREKELKAGRQLYVQRENLSDDLLKTAKIFYLRKVRNHSWGEIEIKCNCPRTQALERAKNFELALDQTVKDYLAQYSV